MPTSTRVVRRAQTPSPPRGEKASKRARVADVSCPGDAATDPNAKGQAATTPVAPDTPIAMNPKSSASDSDTRTPSEPSLSPPVEVDRAALSPDALEMLDGIEDAGEITKESESVEVKELNRFCDDIDLARTRLCSEDETRWPELKELKTFFARFAALREGNAHSQVGHDLYRALQTKSLTELRYALKAASDYTRAMKMGLTTDSPQRRGHTKISDRQRQALKNWRWKPEENGYESFDAMTKQEASTILSALIAAKHKPMMVVEIDDAGTLSA